MITHFVVNYEKCRKYVFLGGYAQIFTYYIGRVIEIYYNVTWGRGLPNSFQYYNGGAGGGSLGTPNLYYVIYGRPLITISVARTRFTWIKDIFIIEYVLVALLVVLWDSLWGRLLTWLVSYWELRWRDDQRRALIDLNAYFLQTHKCIFVFSFHFNNHFWLLNLESRVLSEEDREGRAKIGVHFVQLMHLKGGHLATSWLTFRTEFFSR